MLRDTKTCTFRCRSFFVYNRCNIVYNIEN